MAQVKIRTDELKGKLKIISAKMEQGNTIALYEMKNLLEEYGCQWTEISKQIEPSIFSAMWVLNTILGELWSNLGEDCDGFPKKEGKPYIQEITEYLGVFTQRALSVEYEKDRDPLCQAVTKVFELFRLVDERLMKEGKKPNEEWCVL
jgi:hypothetical protein